MRFPLRCSMDVADLVVQVVDYGATTWRQQPDELARTRLESVLFEYDTGLNQLDTVASSRHYPPEDALVGVDLEQC